MAAMQRNSLLLLKFTAFSIFWIDTNCPVSKTDWSSISMVFIDQISVQMVQHDHLELFLRKSASNSFSMVNTYPIPLVL